MEVLLLCIGKSTDKWLKEPVDDYIKRLSHYIKFSFQCLPDIKSASRLSKKQIKEEEGKILMSMVNPSDHVILLDERGKEYTSEEFAQRLDKFSIQSLKRIIFIIGGPYGFSEALYKRANSLLALSKMTFTHNMIRLFFIEQLYRAMTIIKGESYHH